MKTRKSTHQFVKEWLKYKVNEMSYRPKKFNTSFYSLNISGRKLPVNVTITESGACFVSWKTKRLEKPRSVYMDI